jgi:hypothetical protein
VVGQLSDAVPITSVRQAAAVCNVSPPAVRRWLSLWLIAEPPCSCDECRRFQSDEARARGRRQAQERLPADVRQQLLDAIYAGQPFRAIVRDLLARRHCSDPGDDLDPSHMHRLEPLSFDLGILVWDCADEVVTPAILVDLARCRLLRLDQLDRFEPDQLV